MKEWITESALSTLELGRMLGELLIPGDFLALTGDLGAGKTQFAKGIALGLGIPADEPVCSPSYTILTIHQGRIPLYHFDLYRLSDDGQIDELGFDEYFEGDGVCVVEWAERMGSRIPGNTLKILLAHEGPERRRLQFLPTGERSNELVHRLFVLVPHKSV